ncbi:hypothetical protein NC652_038805 [Populus alba x Populus x berolinensis]|nr:hypothetical protein NC652_038805 [Populus alba x Populus x berolinensis]
MEAARRKEGDNRLSSIAVEKNHFPSITIYPLRSLGVNGSKCRSTVSSDNQLMNQEQKGTDILVMIL